MRVKVTLHSILRNRLPSEARGRTVLDLPEGSTLADVLVHFDIAFRVVSFVNGKMAADPAQPLGEGDAVEVFLPVTGG